MIPLISFVYKRTHPLYFLAPTMERRPKKKQQRQTTVNRDHYRSFPWSPTGHAADPRNLHQTFGNY